MEERPKNEGQPQIQTLEKKKFNKYEVVERLKDGGFNNPEAKAYLLGWIDQEQAEVEKIGTSKAVLDFNVVWAKVYRDAGMVEEAIEAFDQAAEQAWQERDEALYTELESEIEKLKSLE